MDLVNGREKRNTQHEHVHDECAIENVMANAHRLHTRGLRGRTRTGLENEAMPHVENSGRENRTTHQKHACMVGKWARKSHHPAEACND